MMTFNPPKNLEDRQKWQLKAGSKRYAFPKSYSFALPCFGGQGVHKVCAQHFRFVFSFGKAKFRSMMTSLWRNRRQGNVLIDSDAESMEGKEEQKWVKNF